MNRISEQVKISMSELSIGLVYDLTISVGSVEKYRQLYNKIKEGILNGQAKNMR